jgi:hypothetical protein
MVNILRKYQQGLMIIITILVIIAFAWLYNGTRFEKIGIGTVARIYDRSLTQADVDRIARKFSLSLQLGLFDLARELGNGRTEAEALENFVWNSLVLDHEAQRLQVAPQPDEVAARMKSLPAFQTGGVFDPQKYATMVQDALGPRGFTEDQLEQLARDDIKLHRIKALIGATVDLSAAEFRAIYEQENRKMEISVIRFKTADIAAGIQVSDEDLKKAFDERKDTLKSDEKRRVKYVNFALGEAEKSLKGKERLDALQKLANTADEFVQAALAKDANFDTLAAQHKVTTVETGEFTQSQPDPELKKIPGAVEAAFGLNSAEASSDIVRSESGFTILHLVNIVPSRPLTFDEAKFKLTEQLKNERAREALTVKVGETRTKLQTALSSGKSFADTAKSLGLKIEPFPPSSLAEPNLDKPDAQEIVGKAIELNDGQLSDFIPTQDGGLLVRLDKRLPIDEAQFEKDKVRLMNNYAESRREVAFREWLRVRREEARAPSA